MSPKALFSYAKSALSKCYSEEEAQQLAFILITHLTKMTKSQIILDSDISNFDKVKFELMLNRLLQNEPIQYVLNEAPFLDKTFFVNEHTLIPRPETEELVHIIYGENISKTALQILDIGTGSGCIPISLALLLPSNHYSAIDISRKALEVALQNANSHNVKINFIQADILKPDKLNSELDYLDIIVSNPPYVLENEKPMMLKNVLEFEPHTALFVPNDNALLFYEQILKFSTLHLKPKGRVYFEINETKANEMTVLMKKYHFYDVEIKNDFNNKARFAIGTYTPQ